MSANKPKTKAVKEWNFMDQELDDRKKKILKAIIKTYMKTGEPVGSRTISKYADLNVSSATIRNEMSDLTDMGYIVQPHTSAGRIPSDKGYRLYVDELMKEKESEVQEIKALTDEVKKTKEYKAKDKVRKAIDKRLKEKKAALTEAVAAKYAAFTEAEVIDLVVEKKWIATITTMIQSEMQQVTQRLTANIAAIVERYEQTLSVIDAEVSDLEAKVNSHLAKMGFSL